MELEQVQQRAIDEGRIDPNKYDSSARYWAAVSAWYAEQLAAIEASQFRLADDALESANEVAAIQSKLGTLSTQLSNARQAFREALAGHDHCVANGTCSIGNELLMDLENSLFEEPPK